MFEISDKVKVDSEGYVGFAYIREFSGNGHGAYVSVERFSKPFFVRFANLTPNCR